MDTTNIEKVLLKFSKAINSKNKTYQIDSDENENQKSIYYLTDKYTKPNKSIELTSTNKQPVRPWNYSDFLLRLKTFHLTANWFSKPENINPITCARYGWCNNHFNTLTCSHCGIVVKHQSG